MYHMLLIKIFFNNYEKSLCSRIIAQSKRYDFVIPAGSRFWQNGTFEVKKSETDFSEPSTSQLPPQHPGHKSALQVTVPSELQGVAYIQVVIKKLSGK